MIAILIFILVLGLLIFVHELGHFLVAKKAGLKIEEFGFGFPPKIYGIKRGDTTYSINLLPLGGFVKILGEDGDSPDDPKSFANKSLSVRAAILSAGVVMNILLAMVLLIIGFKIGIPTAILDGEDVNVRDPKVQIVTVLADSPAYTAGIRVGDEIKQINGESIETVVEVQDLITENKGKETNFKIGRGEEEIVYQVTPREEFPEDQGATGIALVKTGIVSYPWYEAIWKGFISTFTMLGAIVVAFAGIIKNIFIGAGVSEELSGPIGIAVMTGQVAKLGFVYILQFTAILSINLAILNFLPIPALDGGRVLFLIIEKIRGRKITQKTENMIHMTGFILLIGLMILVTFRDVFKFKDLFIGLWDKLF